MELSYFASKTCRPNVTRCWKFKPETCLWEGKGEKKRVARAQTGQPAAAGDGVLAAYHFESLCLSVSVMQSHGGGKWWRQGWRRWADGHQGLQGMRGRRWRQRRDGWKYAPFFPIQHNLGPVCQAGALHHAVLVLVFIVRTAVAEICDFQVWVQLWVLLDLSSPFCRALLARPRPRSQADSPESKAESGTWRNGLRPVAQCCPDVCPTHGEATGIRWQGQSDCLTARCAICSSHCSPLTCARLPRRKHRGEGVRQLGKAALQRVGVKLRRVERARGQFGAVIEREGPWEVGIEPPGIVKGWVTWVRAQQGGWFGVTRGT